MDLLVKVILTGFLCLGLARSYAAGPAEITFKAKPAAVDSAGPVLSEKQRQSIKNDLFIVEGISVNLVEQNGLWAIFKACNSCKTLRKRLTDDTEIVVLTASGSKNIGIQDVSLGLKHKTIIMYAQVKDVVWSLFIDES